MMFSKCRTCLVLFAVVAIALVAVQPAVAAVAGSKYATNIFSEDFESYTADGTVASELGAQSTWTVIGGNGVLVGTDADGNDKLGTKFLYGGNNSILGVPAEPPGTYEHAIALGGAQQFSLDFRGWINGALAASNESTFGFGAGGAPPSLYFRAENSGLWELTGDGTMSTGTISVPHVPFPGFQIDSLRMDVDLTALTVEMFYDYTNPQTGPWISAGQLTLLAAASTIDSLSGIYDSTSGVLSFSVDDINVTVIPEPSSLILVVAGMLGMLLPLRRRK